MNFCETSQFDKLTKRYFRLELYWFISVKYSNMHHSSVFCSLVLHSAEVLFQSPDPLLTRRPVKVTDAPEQFSEDRCLFLSQSWFEILQHFLGGGLSVHIRLESYEVAQIHQKLVVLSGWCWGGACSRSSRAVLLFFCFFSLARGHAEVVSGSHLGQQRGGGEWGGV